VTTVTGTDAGNVAKRRAIAACLVLVALLAFGTACSSGGSSKADKQARVAAQAKATKAKRARAQAIRRGALAAQRLAVQRRRYARALRRRQAQLPPVTVTPTPTTAMPPTVTPAIRTPVTVTPVTSPPLAPATPAADLASIQRTFSVVTDAFSRGVVPGIVSSLAANYWVASGVYSAAQCSKFEADRGEGVVSEAFVVLPGTLKATPGWVDPTVGKTPTGRIYSMSVANTETLVPTGEKRQQTVVMHASVNPVGTAHLFLRCT
jgi:hypothetical protein